MARYILYLYLCIFSLYTVKYTLYFLCMRHGNEWMETNLCSPKEMREVGPNVYYADRRIKMFSNFIRSFHLFSLVVLIVKYVDLKTPRDSKYFIYQYCNLNRFVDLLLLCYRIKGISQHVHKVILYGNSKVLSSWLGYVRPRLIVSLSIVSSNRLLQKRFDP